MTRSAASSGVSGSSSKSNVTLSSRMVIVSPLREISRLPDSFESTTLPLSSIENVPVVVLVIGPGALSVSV